MTTTPRFEFTGTSTLRQQIYESVGPRSGTRTTSSKVTVTVQAADQADAEEIALAALTTPDDRESSYSDNWTKYHRWIDWEIVTALAPDVAAEEQIRDLNDEASRLDVALYQADARMQAVRDLIEHPVTNNVPQGAAVLVEDLERALGIGQETNR